MVYSLSIIALTAIVVALLIRRDQKHFEEAAFPLLHPNDSKLKEINLILAEVNKESKKQNFSAERYASINLKDKEIILIYGSISGLGFGEYGTEWIKNEITFSVSDFESRDWFYHQPRLFKPLYEGKRYWIFKADVKRIIAEQDAAANP